MNQTDTSALSEPESGVESAPAVSKSGREYVSMATPYLRNGIESGAVTAIVGGTAFLGGLRGLLGGERRRGLTRLTFGAALLTAAVAQRRRTRSGESDIEETDVVDTGPDIEAVAEEAGGVDEKDHGAGEAAADASQNVPTEDTDAVTTGPDVEAVADDVGGVGEEEHVGGEAAAEVADTSPDLPGDETPTAEEGTDAGDDTRTEEIDRLGEAAFDRQSREVPAPQQAFNRGFLAHSAEAFWGIRARDDAVFVSQDYDAIQDRDGVRYVASSEIGVDDRKLPIPDAILDHWDEARDDTAVSGGDDVLFVTTDSLAADGVLCVVPAKWAEDPSE